MTEEVRMISEAGLKEYHCPTILIHRESDERPLVLGFADEAGKVHCFVTLTLLQAYHFAEKFRKHYNETLARVLGDDEALDKILAENEDLEKEK